MGNFQKINVFRSNFFNKTYSGARPFFLLSIIGTLALAITGCNIGAQQGCNWPCFHGQDRTNKSKETGLLKNWPATGPVLLNTISGLGEGYSTVSIADGYIFAAGMADKQTYVMAFDINGNQIWKKPNGQAWETTLPWATTYTGSRSTPAYDNGVVYHLSELGRLAAFDSETGKELWSTELRDRFDSDIPEYGYTESVIVDGDRLYCTPGGKRGYVVCFDKNTGNLVWASKDIKDSLVGNSSLIIFEYGGYKQVAGMTGKSIFGLDSEKGELLWIVGFANSNENNITDPIYYDGYLFASSGYGKGSILLKLEVSGDKIIPKTVWQNDLMDNHHGGIILNNGYLYGSGHNSRGWFCLEFMTGKEMWKSDGKGSLTYADGMLYILDERGIMNLVRATPEKYDLVSSFEVPSGGKGSYWAHPVVCGGRLYIRHTDKIFVYDISEK
jgi:outer membrane protein assembly factor BamB